MLFRCILVCLVLVTVSSLPPFHRPTWPRTSTSLTSADLQDPLPWIKFSHFGNVLNQFPKIVPDIAEAGPKIETDNKRFQVIINVKDYKKENLKTEIKGDYIIIQGLGVNNDIKSSLTSEFSQIYSLPPKSNPSSVTSVLTSDGFLVLNAPLGNVIKKNKIEKVIPITESKEPLHTQELINKSNDVPVLPLYKLVKNENTNSIIEIPQSNEFKGESVTNENKLISLTFAPQQVDEKKPFLSPTLASPTNNNNNVQVVTETLEPVQKFEQVLKTSVNVKLDDTVDHQSENKNEPLTEEVTLKPQQLTTLVNVELSEITAFTILEDSKIENSKYESTLPTVSAVLKTNLNNQNDEIKADAEILKSVDAIGYISENKEFVQKVEPLQETSANVKLDDIEAYQSKNKSELLTDDVTLKPQQLTTLDYAELSSTVTSIILKASKVENSKDESSIPIAILKTNAYNQNDENKAESVTLKSDDAKDDTGDNKKLMLESKPVQETIIDIKLDDIVTRPSENKNEHLIDEVTLKPQQLTTLANVELTNTVTATILKASNIENNEDKESSIPTVTTILQTQLNNQNNDHNLDVLKGQNDVNILPAVTPLLGENDSDVTEEILKKSDTLETNLVSTTDVTTTFLPDSELYTNKQPNKNNDPVISEPVLSESISQISTTTATLQEQEPLSQELSQKQIVEHNDDTEKNNLSLEKSNTAQDAISINIPLPTIPYTTEKSDLSSALEAVRERLSDDIRLVDESLLPELDRTHTFDTIQENVEEKPAVTPDLEKVNGNTEIDKTTLIKEQSLPITVDQLSDTDSTVLSVPSAILLPPLGNVEISKTNTLSDKSSSVINQPTIEEIFEPTIDSTNLPTLQPILPNVANNNTESNKIEVINDQSSTITINQVATTNADSTVLGSEQVVLPNVEISNPTINLGKTYSIAEPVSTVISPASETHFDIST